MSLEPLDITLGSIRHHEPSRFNPAGVPYLIAITSAGVTIKGEMRKPIPGERYRLHGEWRLQKPYKNKPPETAFEFSHHEAIIDQSEAGVAHYLRNYVDGLGIVKATALVEHFGAETLHVLRTEPERALEVHGINAQLVESIQKHFAEATEFDPVAYAALIDMFSAFKVPRRVVKTLLRDWGSDAPQKIKEFPYMLLAFPGMGWKIVDSFATSPAIGYPADGIDRHKAALVEALEQIANDGHTYGTKDEIERIAFGLIGTRPIPDSWDAAVDEMRIMPTEADDKLAYALPKLYAAENEIATRLAALSTMGTPLPFSLPDEGLLEGQRAALRIIEENPVVILAGAPGTGKTYTITRALTGLVSNGFRSIRIVAPTGKAAKRANELTERALPDSGIICSTIHKALEPIPSGAPEGVPKDSAKMGRGRDKFGFARDASYPLDAQVIVCDEASMPDVEIGSSLVQAVANGSRLVFVGDPHQLPPVGPGSMLRDMIAAGVPTATLTEIQRNSGKIVKACHAILRGETPTPSPKVDLANGENWIHLEIQDPVEIGKQIVKLHESARRNGKFDPLWDMQVISPEKRKPGVGCHSLNRALSDLLNTYKRVDPNKVQEDEDNQPPAFEKGDKVIRVKNGLADQMLTSAQLQARGGHDEGYFSWDGERFGLVETDVVNGDVGTVMDVCKTANNWYVVVKFRNPDQLCRLPYGDHNLEPAYAVTCHKAQGSGFPYVIVPVHHSFYQGLWNREMIYTLFSRAETLLVTVGPFAAIPTAINRKTVDHRRTRLRSLVAPAFAPQETARVEA